MVSWNDPSIVVGQQYQLIFYGDGKEILLLLKALLTLVN
jgi:hypothetical protein